MIALTFDAKHVLKKWSTWWSALLAADTAGLLLFSRLSDAVQSAFPSHLLSGMAVVAVLGPVVIPLLTSLQQSNIPAAPEPPKEA